MKFSVFLLIGVSLVACSKESTPKDNATQSEQPSSQTTVLQPQIQTLKKAEELKIDAEQQIKQQQQTIEEQQ